jgi:D-3-phosphoglycerate dehydrogenase
MAGPWRVLVSDRLADTGMTILQQEAEAVLDDSGALGTVDAWIVRSRTRVDGASLTAAVPRLRVVGRAGVGVDNIDLEAARREKVVVVSAPEASTIAVAEHTLALMLALARQIPAGDAALRRGEWPKGRLEGTELHGKTLGLVGIGRIGRAVAERAAAMGMAVIAYDPYLAEEAIRTSGARPAELNELLDASDYVSLHLPLTDETRLMFGPEAIARMKPGARLICAARGGLIDEPALLTALEEQRLAGAALDVFQNEPPGENPLLRHPHVVATPHLGAQTAEAQARVSVDIASEVLAALRGDPLRWRVV